MHTPKMKIAFGLPWFLLIGLLALVSRTSAAATVAANPASPASEYSAWEQWSAPVASTQFDISKCSPGAADARHIQVGDMNGDGRPDLLCKLVAPNGGTTPYVQLAGQGSYSAWAGVAEHRRRAGL